MTFIESVIQSVILLKTSKDLKVVTKLDKSKNLFSSNPSREFTPQKNTLESLINKGVVHWHIFIVKIGHENKTAQKQCQGHFTPVYPYSMSSRLYSA